MRRTSELTEVNFLLRVHDSSLTTGDLDVRLGHEGGDQRVWMVVRHLEREEERKGSAQQQLASRRSNSENKGRWTDLLICLINRKSIEFAENVEDIESGGGRLAVPNE